MSISSKTIARIISIGFFLFWLMVLFAGADKPPPPGFILIVLIDLGAAIVVYYRIPNYLEWQAASQKFRWVRVLLDGLAAGLMAALITMLLPNNGEPSIPSIGPLEYLVWFSVLGCIGMMNAVLVYTAGALLAKLP